MQLLDSETPIGISTMAELKDTQKLVNNVLEDLNKCSSNKENVEQPDNVIYNGTNGNNEKSICPEEPIAEIMQESTKHDIVNCSENGVSSTALDEDTVKSPNRKENNDESQIDSNPISNSPAKNKDTPEQSITELKNNLKIEDSIIQEQNEEVNVNISGVNKLENSDAEVIREEIKNVEAVISENNSESSDDLESKDSCKTEIIDKIKDVIKIIEQIDTTGPKETDDILANENALRDHYQNSETTDAVDLNTITEEIKIQDSKVEKNNEFKLVDTVIIDEKINDSSGNEGTIECDEVTEISVAEVAMSDPMEQSKNDVVLVDEELKERILESKTSTQVSEDNKTEQPVKSRNSSICRLSNTLDILSDDDDDDDDTPKEEVPKTDPPKEPQKLEAVAADKQCINIEDDDDIMVIEEDSTLKDAEMKRDEINKTSEPVTPVNGDTSKIDEETGENKSSFMESIELVSNNNNNDKEPTANVTAATEEIQINEKTVEPDPKSENDNPLLPENFLSLSKKKLSDMTREDLEEFCILKIVESIMDRSQLSDIKAKLKSTVKNYDETRKKVNVLTKQLRDLQVVLKSVQEEHKKVNETYNVITPLKITRSVGMQVLIPDKSGSKRKNTQNTRAGKAPTQTPPRPQKPVANQNIPVPRLVPASNTGLRSPTTSISNTTNTVAKTTITVSNSVKNTPIQKVAEKRSFNKVHAVTVDLTDDEPPAKMPQRGSPVPPVRVVPSQNLMATPRPHNSLSQMLNSPRKVFIPIGAQTGQNLRPGHSIMLKTVAPNGPKPRAPGQNIIRAQNQVRVRTGSMNRHPAPLPDVTKQYQPPNWKTLPPAPDLKLSKVENGIVISWKIDGYQEDLYEQIASYQLYAYQETNSPPSTALWKKIGDVKALPLPMACTLTQFTAGFKYFFAVRAVDVRSRLGPFSLPGSILLLQKM